MTIAGKFAGKLICWLAALAGAAAMAGALPAPAADAPPTAAADPPAGQLLVASRAIQDPRFYHSVILLVRHDKSGAFGIVINHPLGEQPLAALLAESGGKNAGPAGKHGDDKAADAALPGAIQVYLGGPVQPQLGFVIHGADYRRPETLAVAGGLAMTASRELLRDIARHKGPAKYLFALGYAGWGAGQLEAEIARHDWFTAPADPAFVFDADRETLWQTALDRRTREL